MWLEFALGNPPRGRPRGVVVGQPFRATQPMPLILSRKQADAATAVRQGKILIHLGKALRAVKEYQHHNARAAVRKALEHLEVIVQYNKEFP